MTGGYKGLQEFTRCYRGLQGITRGYRGLQGITEVYRGLKQKLISVHRISRKLVFTIEMKNVTNH